LLEKPKKKAPLVHQNQKLVPKVDAVEEDASVRRLCLLSRLFCRKGPRFRLDGVYQRYCAPEKKKKSTDLDGARRSPTVDEW